MCRIQLLSTREGAFHRHRNPMAEKHALRLKIARKMISPSRNDMVLQILLGPNVTLWNHRGGQNRAPCTWRCMPDIAAAPWQAPARPAAPVTG